MTPWHTLVVYSIPRDGLVLRLFSFSARTRLGRRRLFSRLRPPPGHGRPVTMYVVSCLESEYHCLITRSGAGCRDSSGVRL